MPNFHKRGHGPCPVMIVLGLVFVAFFYFLKKYQHSLEDFEAKGGVLVNKCHQRRHQNNMRCAQPQQ